ADARYLLVISRLEHQRARAKPRAPAHKPSQEPPPKAAGSRQHRTGLTPRNQAADRSSSPPTTSRVRWPLGLSGSPPSSKVSTRSFPSGEGEQGKRHPRTKLFRGFGRRFESAMPPVRSAQVHRKTYPHENPS